ncbi:NADP-dependent oxidoreductase [Aureibacter tunicatorum]|uniref:Enoyl reductase (ER) domain-containing protein n=1 Tax=Aureibacter tunicatorum TaxID=866807 RepID=A0AAE3XNM7_9BACT|nr:NADP-dependent oxidoreductase [Aureibacter tunicatorum]MDR6239898.1 hypothetical protein [Aureibacter tunicatorum]BDD04373.1 putative NADP-dependent oxidoreductase YfmJ [Aureibacter tunicatorum]
MAKAIILNHRPIGMATLEDFKIIDFELEKPKDGELKLKTIYISVDPYLRGRMNLAKSYIPPFELGKPIESGMIAQVEESLNEEYKQGDYVTGILPWQEHIISDGKGLMKIDPDLAPLSAYLGVLGLTGITAYLGLLEIGKPKEGETLLVSGAAGAVGSIVGQIGKIKGCHVVGIAGSDEKVLMLEERFGYDKVINYKTSKDLSQEIGKYCSNGVDVYFDNVGGVISDAALDHINKFARISLCGNISLYNEKELPTGPRIQIKLLKKSALMQGFIVFDFKNKYSEAIEELSKWLKNGDLVYEETIVNGFENTPEAFIGLFEGKNKGKMLVKV